MRCSDFLNRYSEYRDGIIADPRLRRRIEQHIRACRPCARYDEVVGRGVAILQRQSEQEPSERFRVRLRCQITMDRARRRRLVARRARIGGSVLATAAVALLLVGHFSDNANEIDPAPLPTARPMPMVTASPSYPFVTFVEMSVPAFQPAYQTRPASLYDDSARVSPPERVSSASLVTQADYLR